MNTNGRSRAERLVQIAALLGLVALAMMALAVVVPRPVPVMLAMSAGQGLGIGALVLYLLAIVSEMRRRTDEKQADKPRG
jgi:MFS family permease